MLYDLVAAVSRRFALEFNHCVAKSLFLKATGKEEVSFVTFSFS